MAKMIFHREIKPYSLPTGVLNEQAWNAVEQILYRIIVSEMGGYFPHSYFITMRETIGEEWTIGGNAAYVGVLTKRISKYLFKTHSVRLTAKQMEEIGNAAAPHCRTASDFLVDFTKVIDWDSTDYGQPDGCCYWSCRAGAKKMIMENGGGAMRFYNESRCGVGRVWFADFTDDFGHYIVIWNSYGPVSLISCARLLAQMNGYSYRKCELRNRGGSTGTLWVNDGNGYIIALQETIDRMTGGSEEKPRLDFDWPELSGDCCVNCEREIDDESTHTYGDEPYCFDCITDFASTCDSCGDWCHHENGIRTVSEEFLCEGCNGDYSECRGCHLYSDSLTEHVNGHEYCDDCRDQFDNCDSCDKLCDGEECDDKRYCCDCIDEAREEYENATAE